MPLCCLAQLIKTQAESRLSFIRFIYSSVGYMNHFFKPVDRKRTYTMVLPLFSQFNDWSILHSEEKHIASLNSLLVVINYFKDDVIWVLSPIYYFPLRLNRRLDSASGYNHTMKWVRKGYELMKYILLMARVWCLAGNTRSIGERSELQELKLKSLFKVSWEPVSQNIF